MISQLVNYFKFFLIILIAVQANLGCTSKGSTTKAERKLDSIALVPIKQKVKIAEAKKGVFLNELYSNGKILSLRKSEIKCATEERLVKIYVTNGQVVKKGQLIAEVDNSRIRTKLEMNKEAIEKARIDLFDRIIQAGYDPEAIDKIPKTQLAALKVRSGFANAELQLKATEQELADTYLRAPYAGIIADLEAQQYSYPSQFKKICTLIDQSTMEVQFKILENELSKIRRSDHVKVLSFYDTVFLCTASIYSINPLVDENGLVNIRAKINQGFGEIIDGMNVRIVLTHPAKEVLMVPKSAVLPLSDRKVVFTYVNGRAIWNYVETGSENSQYVEIRSGIEPGSSVIYQGNINLAHFTEVELIKE